VKPIWFSHHAQERMALRGTSQDEVERAIKEGQREPAREGRFACRLNFEFHGQWQGSHYHVKQVVPVVAEEADRLVVVTVFVLYF